MTPREWLTAAVIYFRNMGFFKAYQALPDTALIDLLEHLHVEEWERNFDPSDKLVDLLLLQWDESRIWWQDTEADVFAGNMVYRKTLEEWSAISQDSFVPSNIQESWMGEAGPVTITFLHNGQTVQLHPQVFDDFIDIGIVAAINDLIIDTGVQFEVYRFFDQSAFILALTRDEKRKLARERRWKFAKLP